MVEFRERDIRGIIPIMPYQRSEKDDIKSTNPVSLFLQTCITEVAISSEGVCRDGKELNILKSGQLHTFEYLKYNESSYP